VATIYDVAKLAGVSVGTVSNVINNKPTVSPVLRKRVEQAMEQIGFVPNTTARTLAKGNQTAIGVLYPFNANHVAGTSYLDFVSHLITYSRLFHHQVVLYPSTQPASALDDVKQIVNSGQVGSFILFEVEMHDRRVEYLLKKRIPFVMVGRTEDTRGLSYVDADVAQIIRDGLNHLKSVGCDRIAHLGRKSNIGVDCRIKAELIESCKRLGLQLDPDMCCQANWEPHERRSVTQFFVQRAKEFDAIVISEAAVRFQFVQEVLRAGLRIPDDFMVLGYMDTPLDAMAYPSITAFDVQSARIVEHAVTALLEKGQSQPKQVLIPGQLIVRDSTRKRSSDED